MKKLLLVLFFTTLCSSSIGQNLYKPDKKAEIGIFGGYSANKHTASFRNIGDIPNCCPKFESGTGSGISVGLLFDFPISEIWSFGFTIDYSNHDAILNSIEKLPLGLNGTKVNGEITHTIDSKIPTFGGEILLGINPIAGLKFQFGARAGYMLKTTFSQKEEITLPPNGALYLDSLGKYFNRYTGEITSAANALFSAIGGLSYDFSLNNKKTLTISPFAYYQFGLNNISEGLDWKVNSLFAGLALKYHIIDFPMPPPQPKPMEPPAPPPPPAEPPPQPPVKPKPELEASVQAVGIDDTGLEVLNIQIFELEEFLSSRVQPLLSYVFFDDNSSVIPDRYSALTSEGTNNFSMNTLLKLDDIETYHHLLNIVGWRLREIPDSKITLIGCNSNSDNEKDNKTLSLKRAISCADYLTNIWKIPLNRITISSRNLPEKPSNPKTPDGIEENRRTEIVSDEERILDPVITYDTLRNANPPVVRFKIKTKSTAGVKNWNLQISANGKLAKSFDGIGSPPEYLDWQMNKELSKSPELWNKIEYKLEVVDNEAMNTQTGNAILPVKAVSIKKKRDEKTTDKSIDKFNLILFDFNSAELNKANKKIAGMIKARIKPTSDVSIYGYTDRTGTGARNKQLAEDRSRATAKAIERIDSKIFSVGSDKLIYDNKLPEGRFYCRTVTILAETPIDNK
ncbi:MAG: OmpA/MotB domain protein [Ignavibacteria bacterium]|nr:OmpA/MotB domain protein [Ignavibacteria bacterium]